MILNALQIPDNSEKISFDTQETTDASSFGPLFQKILQNSQNYEKENKEGTLSQSETDSYPSLTSLIVEILTEKIPETPPKTESIPRGNTDQIKGVDKSGFSNEVGIHGIRHSDPRRPEIPSIVKFLPNPTIYRLEEKPVESNKSDISPEEPFPIPQNFRDNSSKELELQSTKSQRIGGNPFEEFTQNRRPTTTDPQAEASLLATKTSTDNKALQVLKTPPQNISWKTTERKLESVSELEQLELEFTGSKISPSTSQPNGVQKLTPVETIAFTPPTHTTSESETAPSRQANLPLTPETLENTHQVTDQLIRNVRFLSKNGTNQITLHLDPPELGQVTIQLVSKNQTLSGKIAVENPQIYEIVQRNLGTLREALIGQGIQTDQIEVSIDNKGENNSDQDSPSFFDQDHSERSNSQETPNQQQRPSNPKTFNASRNPEGLVDFTA